MAWNKMFSKAGIAVCVGSFIISFSTSAYAGQARLESAQALVADYRELRRSCTQQTGAQRRACFDELHASNRQYHLAKQQLRVGKTADLEIIHLVTF